MVKRFGHPPSGIHVPTAHKSRDSGWLGYLGVDGMYQRIAQRPSRGRNLPPGPLMTACPEPFESILERACVVLTALGSLKAFLTGCATAPQEPSAVWRCPPRFGLQRRISQSAFAIDRREVSVEAMRVSWLASAYDLNVISESTSAPHHELACHDLNGERDEHLPSQASPW